MGPILELRVTSPHTIEVEGKTYRCTIGRGGVTDDKREGDLMTPRGSYPLRGCYFRPDRISPPPKTLLKLTALTPNDGWCDDATHLHYNQHVKLPFSASHEQLWRESPVYDLIIPLGYNDGPIIPGAGSAIFLHIMREDGEGTEGCVAMAREDLLAFLPRLSSTSRVIIE